MAKRIAILLLLATPVFGGGQRSGCDLSVIVGGVTVPTYAHRGTTYVEAIRGSDYTLRLTNPTPYRVAVALSVDGLNTIDAKHTDAWSATKWVLEPYETADIEGWQVSDRAARRFFFTGERGSYAASRGQIDNLGVIEAVFYRERVRSISGLEEGSVQRRSSKDAAAQAPAPGVMSDDEYAGTGMGGRTRHDVERVDIDLERQPIAHMRIRYEFRPQLIKLGVLDVRRSPIERRERARGFDGYCPEP